MSSGGAFIPPAIGFIFDRESRTEKSINELEENSGRKIKFTPRRMFENYLLNPLAIASVASSIDGLRENSITEEKIVVWFDKNRWERTYFKPVVSEDRRTPELWPVKVRGAKILEQIFLELSDARVSYDKVRHGRMLTEWILENSPDDFKDIVDLIKGCFTPED